MRSPRTPMRSQHRQFAAGDDIETVSTLRHVFQDRQIAIRFHRETQRVRERAKPAMQLLSARHR